MAWYTIVDAVPRKRGSKRKLSERWEEFMAMNVKVVKLNRDDFSYKDVHVGRGVMQTSIDRFGQPIRVYVRDGEYYLERTDM